MMEKTLSSTFSGFMMNQIGPRNTAISSGFYSLIRAVRRACSKAEEERITQKEVELIRQNLAQPDISQKRIKEFLMRLIYCEMLGQSASFAYIHALKMAQQGSLLNKRVGYLAVCLFLHPKHELILLLINTIQRDLNSTNILDVCMGLTACSQLIGAEMIPAVVSLVEDKLQHNQAIVRKKAVMVLHSFLLKAPQLIGQMEDKFQQALCDRDPGVMNAALHIYNRLVVENPQNHKSLVRPLTSILAQVIQNKLSAEFEFRGVPAPWLQIQLLGMLGKLGANNPQSSQLMYDVLEQTLENSNTVTSISCAIQYECIMTIARIHPKDDLLTKAAQCIPAFLRTRNNNFKYLGLKALGVIHKVHPQCAIEHQMTVVECLDDPDTTIRKGTLSLLCQMCNHGNVEVISEKLLDCLQSNDEEEFNKKDLLHKIVQLAEKYQPSVRWYVDIVSKILLQGGTHVPANTVNNLMIAILKDTKDPGLPTFAVQLVIPLAGKTALSDQMINLMAWVLGEYGCTEKSPVPSSETISILCQLLHQQKHVSSHTRCGVMLALTKAVGKSRLVTEEVMNVISAMLLSPDVEMKQRASELQELCKDLEIMEIIQHDKHDAAVQTNQFDWTLSFLDEYVSEALEHGAAPYKPKQQRSAEKHNSPEVMRPFLAGLNFKPYDSPSTSMISATGSSGSSLPPPNHRGAGASNPSPEPSVSSGATGNSAEAEENTRSVGIRMEGVRRVWSQQGYSRPYVTKKKLSEMQEKRGGDRSSPSEQRATPQASVEMTSASAVGASSTSMLSLPSAEEIEEQKRKQELARALFGNVPKTKDEHKDLINDRRDTKLLQDSLDRRLQNLDLDTGQGMSFADRCLAEGLVINSDLVRSQQDSDLPEDRKLASDGIQTQKTQSEKSIYDDIQMLLDAEPSSAKGSNDTINRDRHISRKIPDLQVVNDERQTSHAESSHLLRTSRLDKNERGLVDLANHVSESEKSPNLPSLMDMDDRGEMDNLPTMPQELTGHPCSQRTEELVFDALARLVLRRVWKPDALVLIFYLTSLGSMEDVRMVLDVPSNMKCTHNEEETNIFHIENLTARSSAMVIAKLYCTTPAMHMRLGGELTYRDAAKTVKRLFFHTPIHIKDLLRPKELSTEEFGKLWPQHTLDHRLVIERPDVKTINNIMDVIQNIHLSPVEVIGNEGIACGSLLQSATCLLHFKWDRGKLEVWVRSKSKLLSQVVAKHCSALLEKEVQK